MNLLCTFPGKFGDLLWALPTIRAISRRVGAPVHLRVAAAYAGIVPLLQLQPYLASCKALIDWGVLDTAPISPRVPTLPYELFFEGPDHPERFDQILHLGYRDWPTPDVVRHTLETANQEAAAIWFDPGDPDGFTPLTWWDLKLDEPWITLPNPVPLVGPAPLVAAFTDEHFELKFGMLMLTLEALGRQTPDRSFRVLYTAGSRWDRETWKMGRAVPEDWMGYAQVINDANLVLADCSAAHVLAVAMGKRAVLMEPNPHRHNPVFYPLGTDDRVLLVRGNDGQPTFDSRHVLAALI